MKSMKSTVERTNEEEVLKILSEQAPVGVCVMQDGKFCYINSYFSIVTGYAADELVGKDSLDIVVPEDREMVMENTIKMLKGELLSPYQFKVTCKDGSIIWVMATVKSIQYHGRRATLGNYMEITEHKQADVALQAEKNKLQSVIGAMDDGLTIQDKDYNIIYQNEPLRENYGDRLGEKCYRVYEGKDKPCNGCPVKKAFEDGKSHTSVRRAAMPSGEVVFGETTANPIRDAEGKIASCLEVVRNITERKQMEETLQVEKNKLQSVIDAMADVLTIQDTEYNIIYQNEPSKIVYGDHPGEKCYRIYAGREKKCAKCPVEEAFKDGKPRSVERRKVMPSGEVAFWEFTANPIRDAGGRIVSCLEIGRDVTERKQVEEALQAERNKLKSIIDATEDDLTIQDTDYNIIYQNEPAKISTGGDHVGEKCYRVYEGQESICEDCPVEKAFKDGKPHTSERQHLLPSGELSFWENTANPIRDARGKVVSCLEIGRDVTERKKQEQALADELTRRRLLVDQSLDGIVVLDVDAKVVEANQRFAEMLGYTPEEVRELHTWDWDRNFPPEKILEMGRNVDEKGLHLETKHTRMDGSVIDVDISINAAMFREQKLIFCVCRDVTERRKMEEALRQSEEKYRALFDSSVIGMFVMDSETMKIGMCNQAAAKMFGFSSVEEAIGINPLDFILPEEREKDLEIIIEEMFGQDLRRTHEFRVVNKNGIEGWVSVTGARIMHEGRLAGLVSITDITERKQAVEALRQSEERYRTILEEMEDAYFEVDLGGHFTFVNNSVCRDLGYSREELIGMSYKDFTVEDDIESVFRIFNEVYQTGVPNKGFPWKTIRKDRIHGFAETSVSVLRNDKGEIIGFRGVGRDITERRQAEEKLRQSKENYRALFDSSVTGTLVVDAETMKVVIGNQAAVKMFGFSSAEEGVGVNLLDFVSPEEREKALELIKKELFEQDSRRAFDLQAVTKDGRKIWISATGARITHGSRLAGLLSFTDVTERKQTEEKLRQSEENYKTLFNSSVIGMYVLDVETMQVVMGNRAAVEMAGFGSAGEGIGINPLDFVIPEDREQVLGVAAKEFEQDLRRTHEVRVVGKDGGTGWISITSARIMHEGRLAALVSFTDITEHKQAEEALRQSEENYRVLFDSTVIGTIVLDAETMKIAMVNQAAAKMFEFSSAEEARGADPFDFVRPEDKEIISKIAAENLFEQDSRQTYELGVVTRDGREIWINATGASIMHEGKLAGLISFTDITEQKRQSERLMVTDRLASLGELAAGTAHELNNPLTSIIGFSQLLMEKETPDDIREDLKLINNEAQRAAKVTRDLLTFARKHAPVKQHNQINNIIEDVLELRAHLQKMNGIEIERQLDPDLPEIMVDYFQMQQVFLNIIINAEYFMTQAHNKGTLTITTKKQNSSVVISIADDGPGILPENLRRIFDPFFTTKEAGSGTGLGLSICHGIVTEHGGQIYVRSQLGKGATVFVELPINRRAHIKSML